MVSILHKEQGHVRSIMHILFNWAMKWDTSILTG